MENKSALPNRVEKTNILSQLTNMQTELDILEKIISNLEEKLSPIMPQAGALVTSSGDEPSPTFSVVLRNLIAFQMRISTYTNRINNILHDVEL